MLSNVCIRMCIWMLPFLVYAHADWRTVMRSAHHTSSVIVTEMKSSIVNTSFTSSSWINCAQQCTRLSEIKSLYYQTAEQICHCNNGKDSDAITGTDGILYSPMQRRYETQTKAGRQRYVLPDVYANCAEVYNAGYRFTGSYAVNLPWYPGVYFETFCNMEYPDWKVFQRRFDGSLNFTRNWTEYVNGFGSPEGEFWLGLQTVHDDTGKSVCELLITMEAESNNAIQTSGYARYSNFEISDAATNYTLTVGGFSGNVGDALEVHNQMMFSTYDVDNDVSTSNCGIRFLGGWWYEKCHGANLNGLYLSGDHSTFANGVNWRLPWGYYYSLIKTEMMYKCQ